MNNKKVLALINTLIEHIYEEQRDILTYVY